MTPVAEEPNKDTVSFPPARRSSTRRADRFSIMLAGRSGLGKTSFMASLLDSQLPYQEIPHQLVKSDGSLANPVEQEQLFGDEGYQAIFDSTSEIKTFAVELSDCARPMVIEVIDTPGYHLTTNDDYDDEECGDLMTAADLERKLLTFVEEQFGAVFEEEQRINRNPKFEEHRIHALLYFLDVSPQHINPEDIQLIRALAHRINVILVIPKADGLSMQDRSAISDLIMQTIKEHQISIYEFMDEKILPIFFAVSSQFPKISALGSGRQYPWGFVSSEDSYVSDLKLLRHLLFEVASDELKEHTQDVLYERYRSQRMLSSVNH